VHLEVRGPRRTKGADQDSKRCGIVGGEAASFASMEHSKQISINLDGIFPKKNCHKQFFMFLLSEKSDRRQKVVPLNRCQSNNHRNVLIGVVVPLSGYSTDFCRAKATDIERTLLSK
jgi:hypothetical protein